MLDNEENVFIGNIIEKERDVRVGKDDTSPTGVFDCELCFAILTCYTTCGKGCQKAESGSIIADSPIARERWSPCRVFTSLISKESR
jgi:hypothetical protein